MVFLGFGCLVRLQVTGFLGFLVLCVGLLRCSFCCLLPGLFVWWVCGFDCFGWVVVVDLRAGLLGLVLSAFWVLCLLFAAIGLGVFGVFSWGF